jgi:hypothetical protein
LIRGTEAFAAQEQSELERHIKSRKAGSCIERDGRQIVDAEAAFLDHALDFGEPKVAGIVLFERAAGDEAQVVDAEYDGVEDGPVAAIEGTINENVASL